MTQKGGVNKSPPFLLEGFEILIFLSIFDRMEKIHIQHGGGSQNL
jgi:hypothetical protein